MERPSCVRGECPITESTSRHINQVQYVQLPWIFTSQMSCKITVLETKYGRLNMTWILADVKELLLILLGVIC